MNDHCNNQASPHSPVRTVELDHWVHQTAPITPGSYSTSLKSIEWMIIATIKHRPILLCAVLNWTTECTKQRPSLQVLMPPEWVGKGPIGMDTNPITAEGIKRILTPSIILACPPSEYSVPLGREEENQKRNLKIPISSISKNPSEKNQSQESFSQNSCLQIN